MKWSVLLVLSLAATTVTAQTEEPSLAGLAAKERERRKKVAEEGKSSGQLMTNVMPSLSEEKAKEVPKFEKLESYERALDRTVDKFYEVCRDFAGAWVVCSGVFRSEAFAACRKGTDGWKSFIEEEFRLHVKARWNKRCTEAYEEAQGSFEFVRSLYDQLYMDYEKLAAQKGKSRELIPRELPSN